MPFCHLKKKTPAVGQVTKKYQKIVVCNSFIFFIILPVGVNLWNFNWGWGTCLATCVSIFMVLGKF